MNIQAVLAELNIKHKAPGQHEHAREGWVQVDCPWCLRKNRYRLGINLRGGYCNCWTCGPKRLVDALHMISGLPIGRCLEMLKGIEWQRQVKHKRSGRLIVPDGVGPLLLPHCRYLQSRGFDPHRIAQLWGVRAIGLAGRLSWRLWIPITQHGEIVSWTTRSIGDSNKARYLSASPEEESVSHKSVLYGADLARSAIVICEGPLDAWAIGPGAVATLGLSCKRSQVDAMTRFPVRVVCFDSEPDAQRRARALAEDLKAFPGDTYVVRLTTGKDAAEASAKEIKQLREEFLS